MQSITPGCTPMQSAAIINKRRYADGRQVKILHVQQSSDGTTDVDLLPDRVERQAYAPAREGESRHCIRHVRHRVGRMDHGMSGELIPFRDGPGGPNVRVLDIPAISHGVETATRSTFQSGYHRTHKCSGCCRCNVDNQDVCVPVQLAKFEYSCAGSTTAWPFRI